MKLTIVGIKFGSRSSQKTYDYLLKAPDWVDLRSDSVLKKPTGVTPRGISYQPLYVCYTTKVDKLPSHITKQLVVDRDRFVRSTPIPSECKSQPKPIPKSIPQPKVPEKPKRPPIDQKRLEEFVKALAHGEFSV